MTVESISGGAARVLEAERKEAYFTEDTLGIVGLFLDGRELRRIERVSKGWRGRIHSPDQDLYKAVYLRSIYTTEKVPAAKSAQEINYREAVKILSQAMLFGPREWAKYYGSVESVPPPLPKNIDQILNQPSPYFKGKTVAEISILVYRPRLVDGKPLTIAEFAQLIEKPKGNGKSTRFSRYYPYDWDKRFEFSDRELTAFPSTDQPYWIIMTKECCPGTKNLNVRQQTALIEQYPPYKMPNAMELTIGTIATFVHSGLKLFPEDQICGARMEEFFHDTTASIGPFKNLMDFDMDAKGPHDAIHIRAGGLSLDSNSKPRHDHGAVGIQRLQ